MKYAVIGSEGFIGSRIVEALHLGDGAAIVAISPRASAHVLAARFSVDLRSADLESSEGLSKPLERCNTAIHAVAGDPQRLKKLVSALVRAASHAGTRRLIYVSTPYSAGETDPDPSGSSAAALDPESPFHAALIAAERQFLSECNRAAITGIALRTALVYGPRSPLVADVATELRDNTAWLLRGGTGIFNGVYVDNLVAAIRQCLRAKVAPGESLYVADAETVTWHDFYQAIAHELELSASRIRSIDSFAALAHDPVLRQRVPAASDSLRHRFQLSTTKLGFTTASKVLGYSPPIAFRDGVQRSCAWWRFAHGEAPTGASAAHA